MIDFYKLTKTTQRPEQPCVLFVTDLHLRLLYSGLLTQTMKGASLVKRLQFANVPLKKY